MMARSRLTAEEIEELREIETDQEREKNREAKRIVQEYFPEYPRAIGEGEYIFLTPRWLLATDFIRIIPEKHAQEGVSATDRIDKIESLLKELLQEYERLPFQLKMGNAAEKLLFQVYHDFTGETPRDIRNLDGEPWYPEKTGYLKICRSKFSNIHVMHHHQRDHEFDQKVSLIKAARDYWKKWTGKEAPLKGSNARFAGFVSELIILCGKDWTEENAMRAFDTYQKGEGNRRKI